MLLTRQWPARRAGPAIVPVFIPFMGCPARCVFCRQDAQTGVRAGGRGPLRLLADMLDRARHELLRRRAEGLEAPQLAFYGGTFTAIPGDALDLCLDFVRMARADGLLASFRCSTRPDCLDSRMLERLAGAGVAALEFGAQSFDDGVLAISARGYGARDIESACALSMSAGIPFCIQLLPGMPGHSPEQFLEDVRMAIGLGAAMLRFYPCLVLEGTGLAAMWRAGSFEPWSLEKSVDALARGWLLAESAGAHVIRMGLAPERGLESAVLAGPVAADLGSRARGLALVLAVRELIAKAARPPIRLSLPQTCSGYYLGHRGELAGAWRDMGLPPGSIRLGPQDCLELLFGQGAP